MAIIKPFKALRPVSELVSQVAALPYDVVTTREATEIVKDNKYSFLHIDRPEIAFKEPINPYDHKVYEKAREKLFAMIEEKIYIQDERPCLYIYQLNRQNNIQRGIVACTSIDDYLKNVIKKHEHTLPVKEQDRANHVNYTKAHTGPILMTYRENPQIMEIIDKWTLAHSPIYNFISDDDVTQTVWIIDDEEIINRVVSLFAEVKALYIADGHHRTAAAVKVGIDKRANNPDYNGCEEYNYFLSVIFPDTQLTILEYNRLLKNLNGLNEEELLGKIEKNFELVYMGTDAFKPQSKHLFGMYMGGKWYGLKAKPRVFNEDNPVESLDVSILHNLIIAPIFGITDPRNDERIDFVGGIKGVSDLKKRVDSGEMSVAFVLHPTSIDDLMQISDAGCIMPPKSTWFEPKLQSGIFIHSIRD
jgi:uncharacterized protein (DUF1015 family)